MEHIKTVNPNPENVVVKEESTKLSKRKEIKKKGKRQTTKSIHSLQKMFKKQMKKTKKGKR